MLTVFLSNFTVLPFAKKNTINVNFFILHQYGKNTFRPTKVLITNFNFKFVTRQNLLMQALSLPYDPPYMRPNRNAFYFL